MSTHFSANQYEQAFAAKRLQNWEVPQMFKERPSTLEGFTRIISNDRGHILEGIPRSSKSPWGEFVGTWEMQKPPLRTKTLKTKAMVEKMQDEKSTYPTKLRTPSPQKEKTPDPNQARTPSPTKIRTPTPQAASPTKLRTPTPECAKMRTPSPNGRKSASPVQRKSPELDAEH